MNIKPLPKSWLIHEIDYFPPTEKDDWGNVVQSDPIHIEHVRFDDSTVFSRDSTQTKVVADAIVFVDATHSTPLPEDFKEEAKIKFNGKDYVIKKPIPCYYPNKNEIHHWELEVV